jgi:hypothetical protein
MYKVFVLTFHHSNQPQSDIIASAKFNAGGEFIAKLL